MIKNIPNKYDMNSLLSEINKNHWGKFDFFYLPIDYVVSKNNFRIIVMWVMHSSTLFILYTFLTFSMPMKEQNGQIINLKRFVNLSMDESKDKKI